MNCNQFDATLDRYVAASLDEGECVSLELHAAGCERCERRLDAATSIAPIDPAVEPPASLRSDVLIGVRLARRAAERRRWLTVATAAAAAAVIAISLSPDEKHAIDVEGTVSLVAANRARPEFEELDAAARELESELRAHPDDVELKQYLATVNDRRDALSRRIREASL